MPNNLPWQEVFYLAFQVLKLLPKELWNLTPKELMLMINSLLPSNNLNKNELEQLIAKFSHSNHEFNHENQEHQE